ncbi:hypothetical protein [Anditalea andensis]|uniref:Uncharacterized protein n=1 Tax=Anditalea andensis TaxID=1048983 RepID=A0A074LG54_9BACT|nr:hypothetical protein [Anditalea andensis]KEO72777.1 hypothetical protein EL17_14165 [Anditalea andensis]
MKLIKKISIAVFLGFLGCVDSQMEEFHEGEDQEEWLKEVRSILQGERFEPPGKLHTISQFAGESESSLMGYTQLFYNQNGQEVLMLGFTAQNDTMRVLLKNLDPDGKKIEECLYRHPNWAGNMDEMKWSRTNYFIYDESGRVIEEEFDNKSNEKQPYKVYHYNERGLAEEIEIIHNSKLEERWILEYDGEERLIKESWWFPSAESPHTEFFYKYNENNLLEAKETWTISLNPELEDVFQYFYDDQGRLIEEKEYYPHGGFSLLYRRTYEYHGEVN